MGVAGKLERHVKVTCRNDHVHLALGASGYCAIRCRVHELKLETTMML